MKTHNSIHPSLIGFQIVVTASLLEEKGSWDDLLSIIKRHSKFNWLSFLSRSQTLILGDKITEPLRQVEFIRCMMSHRLQRKIEKLAIENKNADKMLVITPDILGILQEMAIMYGSDDNSKCFTEEEDFDDYGRAVLIVAEMLHGGEKDPSMETMVFEVSRQSSRVGKNIHWRFIARSMIQYDINKTERNLNVDWFHSVFFEATGVKLLDYFLGGMIAYLFECSRTLEDLRTNWFPLNVSGCPEVERKLLVEFLKVRSANLEQVQHCMHEFETYRHPKQWTLIPIQKYPIIKFDHYYTINPGGLPASLFDGVYFAILDYYRNNFEEAERHQAVGLLAQKYGLVTEIYVEKILVQLFGERLIKLPVSNIKNRKRCDYAIVYPNKVILVEVKSSRFTSPRYYSCSSIDDLKKLLADKIELTDAVTQIKNTIEDLRNFQIKDERLSRFDWTTTSIIPVVLLEQDIPTVPFAWESLYTEFDLELRSLEIGIGNVGFLRFLTLEDLTYLFDVDSFSEIAKELHIWGQQPETRSSSFKNFLYSRNIPLENKQMQKGFGDACNLLASHLGLSWRWEQSQNSDLRPT